MGKKRKHNTQRQGNPSSWLANLILVIAPAVCLTLLYWVVTEDRLPVGPAIWATLVPIPIQYGYWRWLQSQRLDKSYRMPLLFVLLWPAILGAVTYVFTAPESKWGEDAALMTGGVLFVILGLTWHWYFRNHID